MFKFFSKMEGIDGFDLPRGVFGFQIENEL